MNKSVSKVWIFASDSNLQVNYETLQYTDGTTSCNCKGWTRRTAADGGRSCKHTRLVDMQAADSHCLSTHTYEASNSRLPITNPRNEKHKTIKTYKLGQRKLTV